MVINDTEASRLKDPKASAALASDEGVASHGSSLSGPVIREGLPPKPSLPTEMLA